MRLNLRHWIGAAGLALATQACVVPDASQNVNAGYYPGTYTNSASVSTPQPYTVATMPPDPLFEQMTASPGYGQVWIDGSWHWNGYEWVWVSGRWEQEQVGQVYVQPYYDYVEGAYIYTPGYWSQPERLPRGSIVRDHRDGRPTYIAPVHGGRPPGYTAPTPTGPNHQYPIHPTPARSSHHGPPQAVQAATPAGVQPG